MYFILLGCGAGSDSRGYGGSAGFTVYLCYIFTICCRAVALGLTAEDMVAVQDLQCIYAIYILYVVGL